MAWYRKLRLRRIARWMANGFFRKEAVKLTALEGRNPFTGRTFSVSLPVTRTYVKAMMRHRYAMYRQAQKEGLSNAEYERRVYDYYASKGWINPDGSLDYWAEIRDYQRKTDYRFRQARTPYDPSKPHKKLKDGEIDKAHIASQRKRYQKQAKTKEEGIQYTGEGKPIGRVVFDEKTGHFVVKHD